MIKSAHAGQYPRVDVGVRDTRFSGLMETHLAAVWRSLRRLGVPQGAVDDATQQVFLVASRRLDEIEVGRERNYLMGIALRVASDARRSFKRRREVAMEAVEERHEPQEARPDETLVRKQKLAVLQEVLASLPDELRDAFVLYEIEEQSGVEVAKLLDIPPGTVASRVRRARAMIRERLAAQGGGHHG